MTDVIQVWAPHAGEIALACNGALYQMSKNAEGWWAVATPFVEHGCDYAFQIDGAGPFPDPRSAWQPQGVHGPSRRLDHARFNWSDADRQPVPLSAAVIYELHIGTFTTGGTFETAIGKLDELVSLGITHVELMPVAEFSGARGWGYDGVALFAPHHAYGGPEGLKRLVDACHTRGLAVVLDVVYNHLGPAGNYLGRYGPYFTGRYATPWGEAVNLDGPDSDEVRRFFIDNALMWLRDYHIDGLRIDAVHAFADTSAIHFLEQLAAETRALEAHLGRHLVLIAESDLNDARLVRSTDAGGYGLNAQWNEDFHHALHAVLTGETHGYYDDFGSLADLAKVLTRGLVYDGVYSAYRRRRHGRSALGLSGHCFVGCLQNHDQVGNRALGERTSRLLTPGRLRIGAAIVLLSPFVPMLFQGEEWGAATPFLYFTDHADPELGEAVRRGRRREFAAFGWKAEEIPDPQAEDTWLRSRLDWSEAARSPHRDLRQWHQDLIRLRRRYPALSDGRLDRVQVRFDEAAGWLVMVREPLLVLCNLAGVIRDVSLTCCNTPPVTIHAGRGALLASTDGVSVSGTTVTLPAEAVVVFETTRSDRSDPAGKVT